MFLAALLSMSSPVVRTTAAMKSAGGVCSSGAQCQSAFCEWPRGKRLTSKPVRGVCASIAPPRDQMCGRFTVEKSRIVLGACH